MQAYDGIESQQGRADVGKDKIVTKNGFSRNEALVIL